MAKYVAVIFVLAVAAGIILYGCNSITEVPDTTTTTASTTTTSSTSSSTSSTVPTSTSTTTSTTTSTAPGPTYNLSGYIYKFSEQDGYMSGSIQVDLHDAASHALVASITTMGWGFYYMENVPAGNYVVSASFEGWQISPKTIALVTGDATADLVGTPEGWQVVQCADLAGYKTLNDIAEIGSNGIFVIGSDDTGSVILRSTDSGYNWSAAFTDQPTSEEIVGISDIGGEAMIATRSGKLYTSSGGVTSWNYVGKISLITDEAGQFIKSFSAASADTWAVIYSYLIGEMDYQKKILLTTNGGSSFQDISPYSAADYRNSFTQVQVISAADIIAAGNAWALFGEGGQYAVVHRYNGSIWQALGDLGDIPNVIWHTLRIRGTRGYAATSNHLYVSSDLSSWTIDPLGGSAVLASYLPPSGFSGALTVGPSGLILRHE